MWIPAEYPVRSLVALLLLFACPFASADEPAKSYAKPSSETLKKMLTPLQYEVTQKNDTERPFKNEFWDHKADGIYVDVVTGEPLFSSKDKYDSGTGWPSFSKSLDSGRIVEKQDASLLLGDRTEIRSKSGDSHLGHVFDDGPGPDGKRFCVNSASLRFIPAGELIVRGYGQFAHLFPGAFAKASSEKPAALPSGAPRRETAILAGGCFWSVEPAFEKLDGVIDAVSGYTGGWKENPTYEETTTGKTGHAEAVRVTFDPAKISFEKILEIFWRNIDPTDAGGQFVDRGSQYRSGIFYASPEQKRVAEESRRKLAESGRFGGKPIVTEITAAGPFYPAEDYHQDFYKKKPAHYEACAKGSGREEFIRKTWGK